MPLSSWSTTASSNATADSASGISWAEGMNPAGVNDSARAMMAVLKGDFDKSHSANGYQKFPNGLILQWGSVANGGSGTQAVSYSVTFPTATLAVVASPTYPSLSGTSLITAYASSHTTTGFTLERRALIGTATSPSADTSSANWIAVGY